MELLAGALATVGALMLAGMTVLFVAILVFLFREPS